VSEDWWQDPDNVAWLVAWMRNDGYFEHILSNVAERPREWSWQYRRARKGDS
jgi:hypothetical protein